MLQQTTVAAVKPFYERFLERFPTVEALAAAPVERRDAGLGRPRLLLARPQPPRLRQGRRRAPWRALPARRRRSSRSCPGIGAYTAAAIAAIAFERPAAAVDGNVERVVSRLFLVEEPLPQGEGPRSARSPQALVPHDRPGDFAQALMDLGATICTPKRPACALCPGWRPAGRGPQALQESLPRKESEGRGPAAPRRGLRGAARGRCGAPADARRRSGLLGGMAEPPTSAWAAGLRPGQGHARRAARGALEAPARRGAAHLHPFPARADGLPREGRRATPRRPRACAGPPAARSPRRRCPA